MKTLLLTALIFGLTTVAVADDWYSNQRNSTPQANPYSLDRYRIPSQIPQRTAPPPVGSSNTTPTVGGGSSTRYNNGAICNSVPTVGGGYSTYCN